MKVKLAIAAVSIFGAIVLGYAYIRGYLSICADLREAVQERLAVPSTYQRIGVDESRRTLTFDEFFTTRCEPCLNRSENR
jgi:hypothetical protein